MWGGVPFGMQLKTSILFWGGGRVGKVGIVEIGTGRWRGYCAWKYTRNAQCLRREMVYT